MRRGIGFGVFFLLSLAGIVSAQTEFSADIVDLLKPGTPVLAKIWFGSERRRLEIQAASDEGLTAMTLSAPTVGKPGTDLRVVGSGNAIILDRANHTSTILVPEQKVYYTGPSVRAPELYTLYAIVHPVNVDDACPEWMHGPNVAGETCKKVGDEKVNGRNTVKYDLSCYGETCHLWIDRTLHAIVKRQTIWNSTELRNIREIPPDYSLFQIPPGYTEQTATGGVIQLRRPE
ncbi:MAG TPA: hypothetical protein VMH04_06945 [Candidatus Solibacter sp.]|nr:hypothetical protein [Candidatus Solibacter sp.]